MRKLIVSMNITLDGYLSGLHCELDWHVKSWTKEMGDALCQQLAAADTILLGRVTYNAMAKYWPLKLIHPSTRGEDFAFASMMNQYVKVVFTNTITHTQWNNSKPVSGNPEAEITALKKQPGKDMIVYGSGKLVHALMQCSLVDEYQLWLHPVILGRGKPLFHNLYESQDLKLLHSKTFPSGVVLLHYQLIKIKQNENSKRKNKQGILKRQL